MHDSELVLVSGRTAKANHYFKQSYLVFPGL